LDLVAPEATHDTPAATRRETSELAFGHFSQNSQFRRLRNEVLRLGRERFGDLCGQGWQVLPHKKVIDLTVDRATRDRGDPSWLIEKVFAAVASLCDLIFVRGQDALCGLARVRVQLAFPFRCLVFLLSFFLSLQIEKQKALFQSKSRRTSTSL
jgi:hypothetical protein